MMLPDRQVLAIPLPQESSSENTEHLRSMLDGAEAWITAGRVDLALGGRSSSPRVICIPMIVFRAFHPDLTYAFKKSNRKLINLNNHYNSSIILWAWREGLSLEATRALFTERVFRKLGFLDEWEFSVEALRSSFEGTDLDFKPFFLRAKRMGSFMHSINHPKLGVLLQMAEQIAVLIGGGRAIAEDLALEMLDDGLSATVWPIYPEIAESFSLAGSYEWRMQDRRYKGLESYIRNSFSVYGAECVERNDILFGDRCGETFFRVLEEESGGRT